MRLFPGRTLEELDNIDWGRFLAAQQALHIREIEEKRIAQQTGLIKAEQLTQADWDAIARHEELLARWPVNPE